MANHSLKINDTLKSEAPDFEDVFKILWLTGISVSIAGIFVQAAFFILIPNCRKCDESVLVQLSVARILNTVCEFCITNVRLSVLLKDFVYGLYIHTDCVLVCWMFVFSKNIYDKVVLVFSSRRFNLTYLSVMIWLITSPLGLTFVMLLKYTTAESVEKFYTTYALLKFIVVIVNALIFIEIFYVIYRQGLKNRDLVEVIKTAAVTIGLVCLTSVQVFTTDLLSILYGKNQVLITTFCVINSFQIVLITIIFVNLAKSKVKNSVLRTMSISLREMF